MWIAIYINCVHGKFLPYGFFKTEAEAQEFCDKQHEPGLWEAMEVIVP